MNHRFSAPILPWLFLAPALLLLGLFVFVPIAYLLWLSVTTGHLTDRGLVG